MADLGDDETVFELAADHRRVALLFANGVTGRGPDEQEIRVLPGSVLAVSHAGNLALSRVCRQDDADLGAVLAG